MSEVKYELLANVILTELAYTEIGHCARVDYLDRAEAIEICQRIATKKLDYELNVRILATGDGDAATDNLFISTDYAIELRNRKRIRLCLFVPSDIVDAAFSSLANSFEIIDGRELQVKALNQLKAKLSSEAKRLYQEVFSRLRRPLQASTGQQLDFVGSVFEHDQIESLSQVGSELWRVGLVADAGSDFDTRLTRNRDCMRKLALPSKLHATVGERVQSIGADPETTMNLTQFFRGKRMQDRQDWSRSLANGEGPTLDQWIFPEEDPSDIRSVTIRAFIGPDGIVQKSCKLVQPDGAGGSLLALCDPKNTMVVHWITDPPKPENLNRWRIEMIPSSGELSEIDIDLPSLEVSGDKRSSTIKLDIDIEETPDFGLCIRVSALDAAGQEIISAETSNPICDLSDEFFLVTQLTEVPLEPTRESRRTVPTISFGRLEAAIEAREDTLIETQPQWLGGNVDYFSLRLNERRVLNIGLSGTLVELQRRVIADSQSGGCFILSLDEVRTVTPNEFILKQLRSANQGVWSGFWRARKNFFARFDNARPRDVFEAADWTPEHANIAIRYAQAYRELISNLIDTHADSVDLLEALSIDTVLIQVAGVQEDIEEAVVVLPTHPLRAAWFANYTQLLRSWEEEILRRPPRERKRLLDLDTLRTLAPTNVPAFAYHFDSQETFLFFQNLRFFYGIGLPARVLDPHRRFGEIAAILGAEAEQAAVSDLKPDRLAYYMRKFHESHPYLNAFVTTLINPDRGEFFAEAAKQFLKLGLEVNGNQDQLDTSPSFQIVSYVQNKYTSAVRALDSIRYSQTEDAHLRSSDHFLPSLTTTLRDITTLNSVPIPDSHIAVISDFTRPNVVVVSNLDEMTGNMSSFSFYGLITRFIPQFISGDSNLRWLHRIYPEGSGRPELHPTGPKFSNILIELHTALLDAGGFILNGSLNSHPSLEVTLEPDQIHLLERLHEHSNWVISLDRFFALDYYDSPNVSNLEDVARQYMLDYAPEFADGLGHRMMLTTTWRDEIGLLLGRAMDELGFAVVDQSIRQLLHYLKTVSGRLALQSLGSSTSAAASVGLGVVTAWLQSQGRLSQTILVPTDLHVQLFSKEGSGTPKLGERRCDFILFGLKRNIVEAIFVEVKWRRGLTSIDDLAQNMLLQMEGSAQAIRERFFNDDRVDGALQRATLANVLRFYFDRSRRYKLFDPQAEASFLEHLAKLEKTKLDFRPSYEGYIVSLSDEPRKPFPVSEAKITVLTAKDFENVTDFSVSQIWLSEHLGSEGTLEGLGNTERYAIGSSTLSEEAIASTSEGEPEETVPDSEKDKQPIKGDDQGKVIVSLGQAAGAEVDWMPSTKGSPHLFIIGIPGQGKSWTTTRILCELGKQGVPALVLDFHGQFANSDGFYAQLIRPKIIDAALGLPFSPFEVSHEGGANDWRANSLAVAEIFGYVASLGDMQRDVVYTAIRDAYQARGFEKKSPEGLTYPTLQEVLAKIEERESSSRIANVSARCRPLFEMDLFQPTGKDSLDFLSSIESGLVIDLHNLYAESLQLAAGAFVLRKLYKDMFRWGQTDRLRLVIVLDEAHRLARDITLPKLMKEGRKFGIAVVVASQGLGDFHQDVLGNAGTKVIFRSNYPESRKIAGFIRARQGEDLAARIEQLPVGSAYVQTLDMAWGSVVKMYPLE